MYFSTTDGKETCKPDMCAHCNLSTGGQHQQNCPMVRGYELLGIENAKLAEDLFPVDIDRWPLF